MILVLSILFVTTLFAEQPTGTLTIRTQHFLNDGGSAVVNLFREHDEIPKKPWRIEKGNIVDGASTIIFENVPYGAYAVIVFHDENSNGILDHTLFLPAEPMGFSNEWELTLFSGMPSFEKLRFRFTEQSAEIVIAVGE
ncbi:MAG: DUF2141 domain-containing protein [Ignavibacteriales bacterium]|nr:DUF2141 domain-containing protein [Ignavibacteriales bacterium]